MKPITKLHRDKRGDYRKLPWSDEFDAPKVRHIDSAKSLVVGGAAISILIIAAVVIASATQSQKDTK